MRIVDWFQQNKNDPIDSRIVTEIIKVVYKGTYSREASDPQKSNNGDNFEIEGRMEAEEPELPINAVGNNGLSTDSTLPGKTYPLSHPYETVLFECYLFTIFNLSYVPHLVSSTC